MQSSGEQVIPMELQLYHLYNFLKGDKKGMMMQ